MNIWASNMIAISAYAFATQPKTYRDLDSFYTSKYDEYFTRSPWKDSRLFRRDSADVEIYAKKILGITQYVNETKDKKVFHGLCAIAQKHFEAYYKYISRQGKIISLMSLLSALKLHNKSFNDAIAIFGIILMFVRAQNKMINIFGDKSRRFYQRIDERQRRFSYPLISHVNEENRDKTTALLASLQNQFGKIYSLQDFTSSPHCMDNQFYYYAEDISELDALPLESLAQYKYTEEDLLETCAIYTTHFPSANIFDLDRADLFHAFIIALILRSYGRKYQEAKQRILQQAEQLNAAENTATVQAELEQERKKNRRLETKIAALEETIQRLQAKTDAHSIYLTKKINDAMKAHREVIAAKQQMLNAAEIEKTRQLTAIYKLERKAAESAEQLHLLKKQTQDLKNIISSLSTANILHEEIRLDSMRDKKIVIVGGHPQWIAKLQLTCPNYVYIGVDKLNFDPSNLKSADLIAICYLHMNHALFRKTIEYARKHRIPVGYVKYIKDVLYFFN